MPADRINGRTTCNNSNHCNNRARRGGYSHLPPSNIRSQLELAEAARQAGEAQQRNAEAQQRYLQMLLESTDSNVGASGSSSARDRGGWRGGRGGVARPVGLAQPQSRVGYAQPQDGAIVNYGPPQGEALIGSAQPQGGAMVAVKPPTRPAAWRQQRERKRVHRGPSRNTPSNQRRKVRRAEERVAAAAAAAAAASQPVVQTDADGETVNKGTKRKRADEESDRDSKRR